MSDTQFQTEAVLLGSMIFNGSLIEECYIEPHELVADDRHSAILEFLKYANDDESIEKVDLIVLAKVAQENGGGLDTVGGVPYLQQLASSVPSMIQFDYYQNAIRESYIERETKFRITQLATSIGQGENITEHLNRIQDQVEELREMMPKKREDTIYKVSDILSGHIETVEKRGETIGIIGAHTVSTELDKLTNGHKPTKFEVVAARPSVGKTAYAINDGLKVVSEPDAGVLFYSCEMEREELVDRMISITSNLEAKKLETGVFDIEDWKKFRYSVSKLNDHHFYIDDTPGISIEHVRRSAKKMVKLLREQGINKIVIYIDYLQILKSDRKFKDRQAEVTHISGLCKLITRELKVTVVALSQLSRNVEQRQDKRPLMSDLRESGAIEQDADIITFLYRDDYYNNQSDKRGIIEVIVAKQRGGATGTVEMLFRRQFGKFIDLDVGQSKESATNATKE